MLHLLWGGGGGGGGGGQDTIKTSSTASADHHTGFVKGAEILGTSTDSFDLTALLQYGCVSKVFMPINFLVVMFCHNNRCFFSLFPPPPLPSPYIYKQFKL